MSTAASQRRSDPARLLVVMGVAGCGKSTIAEALAGRLNVTYLDGDTFHPQANLDKMSSGIPLKDEDRWPWLEAVGKAMAAEPGIVIGACSSLKRRYRTHMEAAAREPITFIYLDGSRELIAKRMAKREGHFMPTSLLDSQFAALEIPTTDENAIAIDISGPSADVVDSIITKLDLNKKGGGHA